MYYPVGQKFTQNRSISYSFQDIKTFSFSAKIKVAITQLAMDLQVSKFAITQYINKATAAAFISRLESVIMEN